MTCWGGLLRCVPNTGDTLLIPRRDQGSGEATDTHEDSKLGALLTALVPRTRMTPSTRSRLRMCTQPPTAPTTPTNNIRGPSSRLVVPGGTHQATVFKEERVSERPLQRRQVLQCPSLASLASLASGAWAPRGRGRQPLFRSKSEGNFKVIKYEGGSHPTNQIPEGNLRGVHAQGLMGGAVYPSAAPTLSHVNPGAPEWGT